MKTSLLSLIYDEKNKKVDFEKAETCEELKEYITQLKKCGYHHLWHNEANAYEHCKMVHNAMLEICEKNKIAYLERKILLVSAFLHDIGKSHKGELKEDGDWSFPMHAYYGEHIVRTLLWNESIEIREAICFFVRNHMKPYYIPEAKDIKKSLLTLAYECPFLPTITTVKNLILLKEADCKGAIKAQEDGYMDILNQVREKAIELGIHNDYVRKYFKTPIEKYNYFHNTHIENPPFTVYVMIGICGSGKSTFIANHLSQYPIVSRDIIRVELGLIQEGEKKALKQEDELNVTKKALELYKAYCENNQTFVIDDINLYRKYRNEIKSSLQKYNANIEYIYVEADDFESVFKRREGQVSSKAILRMQQYMEFPLYIECTKLTIATETRKVVY